MHWLPFLLLICLGLGVGFFGTLIGAGGGFILVPILLLVYPTLRPEVITSISLGVVFLNASSGSIAYARMKRIDYRSAFIFSLATLPGAVAGAFLTSYIPRATFNLVLGILLLTMSVFLLLKPHHQTPHKKTDGKGLVHRTLIDAQGQKHTYSFNIWIGVALSFLVGYLSSLLGIGGGIIHVPALTSLLNFPVHIATATSHFILAFMALAGTAVHIYQGNLREVWPTMLSIGLGIVAGAQVGAYYSHFLKPHWIVRSLAIALLIVSVRLIFS